MKLQWWCDICNQGLKAGYCRASPQLISLYAFSTVYLINDESTYLVKTEYDPSVSHIRNAQTDISCSWDCDHREPFTTARYCPCHSLFFFLYFITAVKAHKWKKTLQVQGFRGLTELVSEGWIETAFVNDAEKRSIQKGMISYWIFTIMPQSFPIGKVKHIKHTSWSKNVYMHTNTWVLCRESQPLKFNEKIMCVQMSRPHFVVGQSF